MRESLHLHWHCLHYIFTTQRLLALQGEVPQQSVQPEDHHVLTAADLQLGEVL